ncbi:uncharacterized protein LAESUDRAFT_754661 [Laetiporus sulphureus 93-53]|uniref:DNA-directed RNA polymerase III subunit RPC9 n=1 Tax=Laetiporus sulphureus 93-53 TaxID=1314785 RepID=A0A165HTM8_9APHY|nr:uncharacterized protein LAESUDRAFT_754661 [Laetiporus sulphureus 93-53]KZT12174.1 hypothetical protein LAESUDRAFT_754661 [Laetiporus sulphureus 93-53]
MEVLNQRAALLSNYEVLTLLRELESDHLARTKTALRIKKEEELAGNHAAKYQVPSDEICENLRTIEVEGIQYLSADYQPTAAQSEAGITQLTRSLSAYDLTKAEKLQIVNLAPVEPVELYVIVEELEDRLGEQMDDILTTVRSSLPDALPIATNDAEDGANANATENVQLTYSVVESQEYTEEDGMWDYDANEILFDETGEGVGVEGDLDVEED